MGHPTVKELALEWMMEASSLLKQHQPQYEVTSHLHSIYH